LVDAMDFNNELWGRERMLEAARQFVKCPANRVVKNLLAYRRRFAGLARQIDDTSVIAMKIGEPCKGESCRDCEMAEARAGPGTPMVAPED
jgi:hypothetical protein